jgi:hypothetical protein
MVQQRFNPRSEDNGTKSRATLVTEAKETVRTRWVRRKINIFDVLADRLIGFLPVSRLSDCLIGASN